MYRVCIGILGTLVALTIHSGPAAAFLEPKTELRIAAASDMARALSELLPVFERQTGIKVSIVLGSTGLLARQIENGAPFDLFLAADERYVVDLEKAGKIERGTCRLYAVGRLVLWAATDHPLPATVRELAGEHYAHIAIANPQHAPYGRAAMGAFEKAGIRQTVGAKLIYGENVQQALRYAESGSADIAIVSRSLVTGGRFVEVPQNLYPPIRQALGVISGSTNESAARRLAAFLIGPVSRSILPRYGFGLP